MKDSEVSDLLSKAKVTHMSNAKWRKFLEACESFNEPINGVQWKFVWSKEPFFNTIYVRNALINESTFGDCTPAPYAELREIEWVSIPEFYEDPRSDPKRRLPQKNNNIKMIVEHIMKYGQFPIFYNENGFQVLGYEW